MRSTTIPRTRRTARRAPDTRAAHVLARAGLIAQGIVYILIGWVAALVALGRGSHEADQQGALQLLAGKRYGTVSLWLLGIGFAAYSLWRLSEAAYGVAGEGNRAGPIGPVLLLLVALGLAVFGVYGLSEARWRKV